MLCDAHTHRTGETGYPMIRGLLAPEERGNGLFSLGVHPMYGKDETLPESYIEWMERANCCAIGECGYDRRSPLSFAQQQALFSAHIRVAERLGKPVIIHAVRSQPELLKLHRDFPGHTPWIIHGCRGRENKLLELADAGFYLSFGEGLLRDAGILEEFFHKLPGDRLLLETDDSPLNLEAVYAAAAAMRGQSLPEFQECIFANFKRVFCYEQ